MSSVKSSIKLYEVICNRDGDKLAAVTENEEEAIVIGI
jgi:hypothetical protein